MKILKYIFFLSIFYRKSDEKGLRRWWRSFKMAVILASSAAGLIPNSVEASKPYVLNNSPSIDSIERTVESIRGGFKPDPSQGQSKVEIV